MNTQDFLAEKIKEYNINLKKLSDLSGIALKHLENLSCGNWNDLPPAPYLRGYFRKLGQILNFNGEELWQNFKNETEVAKSGPTDTLPQNRFLKRSPEKKIWAILVVVLLIGYFGIRFSKIFGRPVLTIYVPEEELTVSRESIITVRGQIKDGDKIIINKEEVPVGEDGLWFKEISLDPGAPNVIEITGKKFLGQEIKTIRKVVYEPLESPGEESNSQNSTSSSTSTEN